MVVGFLIVNDARGRRPQSVPTLQTELRNLDEQRLIGESDVPPLKGTTWGSMVAIPRGPQPSVSPAACVLFLSQVLVTTIEVILSNASLASIEVWTRVTIGLRVWFNCVDCDY